MCMQLHVFTCVFDISGNVPQKQDLVCCGLSMNL